MYNLYEKFRSTDALGLVTTQFLASLNAYFGRDINIFKDAMTEFYHNLSMQTPLSVSNHSVQMNFASMTNLVKNINILIQREILKFKKMKGADNKIIDNGINDYEFKLIKTPLEEVEENIVQSILNDKKIDIRNDSKT